MSFEAVDLIVLSAEAETTSITVLLYKKLLGSSDSKCDVIVHMIVRPTWMLNGS